MKELAPLSGFAQVLSLPPFQAWDLNFFKLIRIAAPVILVCLALFTPGFLTSPSVTSLLAAMSFIGLVACGMTLITISGNVMSFSLGVTLTGATIVFTTVFNVAGLLPAAVATVFFAAFVSGLQGWVVAYFRANPIIVSMAALALLHGALQATTAGYSIFVAAGGSLEFLRGKVFYLPVEFVVFLALAAAGQLVLSFTRFGRYLFLIGDGPAAAQTLGIRSWPVIATAYALAGFFCAAPAMLLAARFGSGNMSYGQGYDYSAITAVLVGGTAIQGGRGSIVRTVAGMAFIALTQNLLVLHGFQEAWQIFGLGILVLAVIVLQAADRTAGANALTTSAVQRTQNQTFRSWGLLALVVLIMALLDIGQWRFLSSATAFSALQQFATLGPVALGLGLAMLAREFDLSVAGMFGMAGCVAVLMGAEHPTLGIALAVLTGALGGAVQGLIITRLRLGSISVTLGGLLVFVGLAYVLTSSRSISYGNLDAALAVDAPIAGIFSLRSLVTVGLFIGAALCISTTRVGRDLVAIGSDRRAAIFAGVNVNGLLVGTFAVSGVLAAFAGSLLSYGLASASPSGLTDVLVPATAAAILGGVSLSGGVGRPLGIAGGVLVLAFLRSGLNALGASPAIHDIAMGLVLFAAAIIDGGTLVRYAKTMTAGQFWRPAEDRRSLGGKENAVSVYSNHHKINTTTGGSADGKEYLR